MARRILQVLVAEPGASLEDLKRVQLLEALQHHPGWTLKLWWPPGAPLPAGSPWQQLVGFHQPWPESEPDLVLLSSAADWQARARWYGTRQLPLLHLLLGAGPLDWGHGAWQQPALRCCLDGALAQALQQRPDVREPIEVLPLGLDPADLPPRAPVRQGPPLILGAAHPPLALAVAQELQRQGVTAQLVLREWPLPPLLAALAAAPQLLVLAPPAPLVPPAPLLELSALAMGLPLVSDRAAEPTGLLQNGRNALLVESAPEPMAAALLQLGDPLQQPLLQQLAAGARATANRQRRAREQQQLHQLLDQCEPLWQQACRCHAEASGRW